MKGTKYFLENNMRGELETRLFAVQDALFSCVQKYGNRSSSLEAFAFSDSIFVRWKDHLEGRRICLPFSKDLWEKIQHLPYRIFIEEGDVVEENLPIIQQIVRNKRFICVTPVSYAFWSVCIAEAAHFPDGVYLGESLWRDTQENLSDEILSAKQFLYRKILFDVEVAHRGDMIELVK